MRYDKATREQVAREVEQAVTRARLEIDQGVKIIPIPVPVDPIRQQIEDDKLCDTSSE